MEQIVSIEKIVKNWKKNVENIISVEKIVKFWNKFNYKSVKKNYFHDETKTADILHR